jgi:hypothetical protein
MNFLKKNLFFLVLVILLISAGIYQLLYSEKMLKHSATKSCKVVWTGSTSGKRVGQPEFDCEMLIKGQTVRINCERKNLDVKIDDCVEIKYSIEDPKVNEVVYERGKIPCQ